jgi:GDPmannose 4,6-dehydratase
MSDGAALARIVRAVCPDEIYNLAAQSHVPTSFAAPDYAGEVNALGALRLLEAVRAAGLEGVRVYQASTSELFGNPPHAPQDETTPFRPCSPYATAKLYAYWTAVTYREAYGLHVSNGILFNHESPLRSTAFVTRKVTNAVARIAHGLQDKLVLGDLDAQRDWGHARDYVAGMWAMLQQPKGDDYVLATGKAHSVRELVEHAFAAIDVSLDWQGSGLTAQGVDRRTGTVRVAVDPAYFVPSPVRALCGDASKARRVLGWSPRTDFASLVSDMMARDLERVSKEDGAVTPLYPADRNLALFSVS